MGFGYISNYWIPLVSEYYRAFADMCNAIITYYRTVRFKLDIIRYASRNPKLSVKTYDRRYRHGTSPITHQNYK